MIRVKKINSKEIVINCELIESIEGGVDTVVSLTTDRKYVVMDSPTEIIGKVIAYRKAIDGSGIDVNFCPDEAEETETVPE